MFDLVLWSFAIALTPVASGLAMRVAIGIGDAIAVGMGWASVGSTQGPHPST